MRRAPIALAAACALMAMTLAVPASAGSGRTTRWVDDDGKAGPTSCGGKRTATKRIQTAIGRSDRNDVVIVCPGIYTGTVEVSGARRGLTIRAYSKGTAIVRPRKSLIDGPLGWIWRVSDVTVQGLVFEFPSSGCGTRTGDVQGLFARYANGLRLLGNRFRTRGADTQGPCGYDDGIRVLSSTGIRVAKNIVRDFKSDGISIERGSRGRVDGNTIQFYHTASGSDDDGDQGIRIVGGARAEVIGNSVRARAGGAHLEIGIVAQDASGTSVIQNNTVSYTETGIGALESKARITSNEALGVGLRRGIHVRGGSGTLVRDNRVRGYALGIEVEVGGTTLRDNDARDNVEQGCLDTTTGDGTAGTANTWSGNVGSPGSTPVDVCPVP